MYEGEITKEVHAKWQLLVNLMAEAFTVPAGFIVRHIENGYQVLIASENKDNPYKAGGVIPLDVNIFCRKVVKECKPLAVFQATKMKEWETNPEVADDGFNTYVGFPIKTADGSVFGTICVMDFKEHELNHTYVELLQHFCSVVELDLILLDELEDVTEKSLHDELTGLYNRRGFNIVSPNHFQYAKRNYNQYAFVIVDINLLKHINDTFGHHVGDEAITVASQALSAASRKSDLVSRVGGDEFYLALPLREESELQVVLNRIHEYLGTHPLEQCTVSICAGYWMGSTQELSSFNLAEALNAADNMLYKNKKLAHAS